MCWVASPPTAAPREFDTSTKTTTKIRQPAATDHWRTRLAIRGLPETIIVRPFEAGDAPDWGDYVRGHRQGTFFHTQEWKHAVERAFGHRCRYLVARRGKSIVGILPLFEVRSLFAGCMLVSVPYATYGGILADDEAATASLYRQAIEVARSIDARSIEFRSFSAAIQSLGVKSSHATFVRRLPESTDELARFLPRKARAAARQARERHGLTILEGDEHLPAVWELYARSMRRLASPNYPFRFFKSLIEASSENHVVHLVRHQRRPVAGLMTFLFRDRVMPYFIGVDERVELYGLSHYLYEENMKWAVERGYQTYDFGRSRLDNTGACNFKRFCGFEPILLEYQTHIAQGCEAPDLSPSSPRWSAARRVWKNLPLSLTRPLGGWLARSIPG